jgi:hypothetical protein
MRRLILAGSIIGLAGLLAATVFAAGGTKVCVPAAGGKALVTPKAGVCRAGSMPTELAAEGDSGVIRWHAALHAAGVNEASPTTVLLATAGPFTVTGHCYERGEVTVAQTYLSTSENGAIAQLGPGTTDPFNVASGEVPAGPQILSGTAEHQHVWDGAASAQTWAATSAGGRLTINGHDNEGVWLQGQTGPACTFSGFLIAE